MNKTLITFETVRDLLMREAGMRKREAESSLAQNRPAPEWSVMAALKITRRRWRKTVVLDFCAEFRQSPASLGKGATDADSTFAPAPHVKPR